VDECKPLVEDGHWTFARAGRLPLRGKAVQVDPIQPTWTPPGTKRSKLKYGETGFNFCFQILLAPLDWGVCDVRVRAASVPPRLRATRPLGGVVAMPKPVLKAPDFSA
jgi:hypothetical protein